MTLASPVALEFVNFTIHLQQAAGADVPGEPAKDVAAIYSPAA
jgi:hypothetical protein